ncbi:MAG: malonyl-CoA decarboxylase [Rhodospirillales bacterium]|nr:MAG: malonyl-CoA decarboxylase [Rhodospirillales bacterium]
MSGSFLGDLLQTIADRGRDLLGMAPRDAASGGEGLAALCEALLSSRGEASGVALAREVLDRWTALDEAGRGAFLSALAERFGPDAKRLRAAAEAYLADPKPGAASALHAAAESRRQELIRRLNLAPGGIGALVRLREELLKRVPGDPALAAVDSDFAHLFASWFNRGFLVLRRIDWTTPANILEKIIRYEAVHEISGWDDLRRRLEPTDRRCFAFFHPRLVDEPLIFVEVALTRGIPSAIAPLLAEGREPIAATDATTAVFYSISNCQDGLRGISFGNFLIKQVVEDLRRELPRLTHFATLSPAPGFAAWLKRERARKKPAAPVARAADALAVLDDPAWIDDPAKVAAARATLTPLAAHYFLRARSLGGRPVDPVARFHLGNGARLERLLPGADLSANGLRQSHGLMVNYLYKLDEIEANHEAYAARGVVAASPAVRKLAPDDPAPAAEAPPVAA